jgi:hypothetical protein
MAHTRSTSPASKTAYPRRGSGFRAKWARPRNKITRRQARQALHEGREPEPVQPRHSALRPRYSPVLAITPRSG